MANRSQTQAVGMAYNIHVSSMLQAYMSMYVQVCCSIWIQLSPVCGLGGRWRIEQKRKTSETAQSAKIKAVQYENGGGFPCYKKSVTTDDL